MSIGPAIWGLRLATIEAIFWASAAFVLYVYAGYPLLLAAWAKITGPKPAGPRGVDRQAGMSVVIAARNEATRLAARLDNLLSLDYPSDRLQVIVVSDGSTDRTLEVLAPYQDSVEVVALPPRGKAAALNAGVARARHPYVVFADARQVFSANALSALAARFVDPDVGAVTGELILGCETAAGRRAGSDRRADGIGNVPEVVPNRRGCERRGHLASSVAEGIGLYWRYEKAVRRLESAVWSTVGATGAIYAIRRTLWRELPEDTLLDDVLTPMRVVLAGRRVVFEESAQAFDQTSRNSSEETRRKIRTLAGNVQILWQEPRLVVPFLNPVWLQYMSHKVGRLLVPYALLTLMTASIVLAPTGIFYAAALAGQAAFYLLGGYGAWLEKSGGPSFVRRAARVAFTFVVMNSSAVAGLLAALLGRKVWRSS